MYQYWLINYSECTTLKQDVNNRGSIWELSVLSAQFFYKPETALKKLQSRGGQCSAHLDPRGQRRPCYGSNLNVH